MSCQQYRIEEGVTDNVETFRDEGQRPDGVQVVKVGKLSAVKDIDHSQAANEHLVLAKDDERFMYSISGITADNEWQSRKELSGKAMGIMENQGMTAHGEIFDNYYYAFQQGGEIQLSNLEQFWDKAKEIRITGDQNKDEFVKVNERKPDGTIDNSILSARADFIVGKQDYRETIRLQQVDYFLKMIELTGKVKPEAAFMLLDLAVEMMDDLNNKDEAVARIRKLNGQFGAEDEMSDEQKAKSKQMEEQKMKETQMMKQLQVALLQAKLAKEQSTAYKNTADAVLKKLDAFIKAMEAASSVGAMPQLAVAADELINEAQQIGGNGNKGSDNQPQKGGMT